MLVLDQLGTSMRARPGTGPLKFIRVSKKGRPVLCRSRLIAILQNPFRAYTYQAGESGCRCPSAQPQFWLVTMLVGFQRGCRSADRNRIRRQMRSPPGSSAVPLRILSVSDREDVRGELRR